MTSVVRTRRLHKKRHTRPVRLFRFGTAVVRRTTTDSNRPAIRGMFWNVYAVKGRLDRSSGCLFQTLTVAKGSRSRQKTGVNESFRTNKISAARTRPL